MSDSAAAAVKVDAAGELPPTVSPSSLATYRSCALKFYFTYVAGWKVPPTEHTVIGNATHDALERLYKDPPGMRTRDRALAHLADAIMEQRARSEVAALLSASPELEATLEQRCEHMLDGLFALEQPMQVQVRPEDCEAWVEATLYGANVRGRIDRMTGGDTSVWRVSDYKTGTPAKPAFIESALFGLFTYAATLAAAHPDGHLPDEVELLYLRERTRIRRPVVRSHLLEHAKTIGRTWRDIRRSSDTQTWPTRTSALCRFCSFAPACPAKVARALPTPGSADHDRLLADKGLSRRNFRTSVTGEAP